MSDRPRPSPLPRLLVTLILPIIGWAAERVSLPGVQSWKLAFLGRPGGAASLAGSMSVVALGIRPAISGFMLVELAALIVPRWRKLRRGTPDQRRTLRRSALIATLLLALVQSWFLSTYLHQGMSFLPDGTLMQETTLASRILVTLTLVSGTFFLLALVWLLDRHGLGNGFSILLGAALVPTIAGFVTTLMRQSSAGDLGPSAALILLASAATVVFATRWILRRHFREPLGAPRNPTSGIVPLITAASLLLVPSTIAAWGLDLGAAALEPGTPVYAFAQVALVALFCVLFSRAFNQPKPIALAMSRIDASSPKSEGLEPGVRQMLSAGIVRALLFLVGVGVLIPTALSRLRIPVMLDALLIVTGTAIVMDLVAEWRARQTLGALTAVWPLHQVALLGVATDALSRAGIPVHARGAYHRTLLYFFGPYIAIDLLVPTDQAAEAERVLHSVLV